jgi:hypothetical protein
MRQDDDDDVIWNKMAIKKRYDEMEMKEMEKGQ